MIQMINKNKVFLPCSDSTCDKAVLCFLGINCGLSSLCVIRLGAYDDSGITSGLYGNMSVALNREIIDDFQLKFD